MKYVPLASGGGIPVVGLGTWQATAQKVEDAVRLGYRHIDTAFNYNNEEAIGNALMKWFSAGKGKREDVFVTSKVKYKKLFNEASAFAMEQQVRAGLVKHIGLSNFNSQQLHRVYDNATIKPSVLQVELHAYMQQKKLRALCKELNIIVTAYSPLGSPAARIHIQNKYNFELNEFPNILGHPVVLELVDKYNKSPAQILLKHLVQQDIVVIPKSANATRIAENLNVFDFELTEEDIGILDAIDRGEQGRIFNFLFFKGIDKHPEYPFARLNDLCF